MQKLLSVVTRERKRSEIQSAMSLEHEEHSLGAYLTQALASGVIEMTLPDKPYSNKQRYRLTAKGVALQRKDANE
ncbi:Fic family protein [uncultured Marinobacter sp.]|uniref:Fic family protein n=1 Tax=unclassified Marinobacter TaxID=83889 RepID=UPI00269F1008